MSELETVEATKDLDSILSSAIETHFEPDDTPPIEGETEEAKAKRLRDERGRFASASTEAKPSEPGTAEAPPAETAPIDQAKPVEPPRNFTAEQKAEFAKLAPEAQQYVAGIEKAREAEYTRRSQETAELKRTAEPFLQAVAPFQQYLAQVAPSIGQTPAGMINAILSAEYQLRTGSQQQKAQAFAQLAQQYNVNLANLAGGIPIQTQPHQAPQFDPVLQQRITALEEARNQDFNRQISAQIEGFEKATDDKGQLRHPHFPKLRSTMALSLANGEVSTLEEAYVKALEPFKSVVEEELTARQKAAESERLAAVERAKKAAPVKSSSSPKGNTQAKGLDAHLNAALEKLGL